MPNFRHTRDYQDETIALIAFEIGVLYAQGKIARVDALESHLMDYAFQWALEFERKLEDGTITGEYLDEVRKFTHDKARHYLGYDEHAIGHDFTGRVT